MESRAPVAFRSWWHGYQTWKDTARKSWLSSCPCSQVGQLRLERSVRGHKDSMTCSFHCSRLYCAVTDGKWKLLKHVLLCNTVHHLHHSKQPTTILNSRAWGSSDCLWGPCCGCWGPREPLGMVLGDPGDGEGRLWQVLPRVLYLSKQNNFTKLPWF